MYFSDWIQRVSVLYSEVQKATERVKVISEKIKNDPTEEKVPTNTTTDKFNKCGEEEVKEVRQIYLLFPSLTFFEVWK